MANIRQKALETGRRRIFLAHWNWLTVIQLGGQLGLGCALLWWILEWNPVNTARVMQTFYDASFTLLSFAVICFLISTVLKTFQYFLFLPRSISKAYMAGLILSQNALLTFLPLRIGEISFPVWLRQEQSIPIASSISYLVAIRLLDLFIIVVVVLIGMGKLDVEINFNRVILAIITFTGLLWGANILLRCSRRNTLFRIVWNAVKPIGSPSHFGSLLLLSVGSFVSSTLQSTFVLKSLGLTVAFSDIAILNALTLLAALLPVHPPGGWGTIDSIQVVILHALNYQPERSIPVILAAHCLYALLALLGGIFGWALRIRNLGH